RNFAGRQPSPSIDGGRQRAAFRRSKSAERPIGRYAPDAGSLLATAATPSLLRSAIAGQQGDECVEGVGWCWVGVGWGGVGCLVEASQVGEVGVVGDGGLGLGFAFGAGLSGIDGVDDGQGVVGGDEAVAGDVEVPIGGAVAGDQV